MQPFLAMITPLTAGHPEHPIYRPPDGIWGPTDPRPTPPIVIPPDSIGPGLPSHPIYLPVHPSHPIVIPPGSLAPGTPEHPIVLPPYYPSHPIVIPPGSVAPGTPSHPIVLPPDGIWGPTDPRPTPPIVLPPEPPDIGSSPLPTPPPAGMSATMAYIPASKRWSWVYAPEATTKPPEGGTPGPSPKK